MRLIKKAQGQGAQATVAQVSYSESQGFGAVAAGERRGIPVFGPRGLSYKPCEGDNLLIISADGGDVCAGVLVHNQGLAPGELGFSSAGGARVVLRNSGDVVINGVTITREGRIVLPEKEE